jgi:hypothetical protein
MKPAMDAVVLDTTETDAETLLRPALGELRGRL